MFGGASAPKLVFMQRSPRRPFLLIEEGAAFAALEGRNFGVRKENAMNQSQAKSSHDEEHFAPVEAWDAIAGAYDQHVTLGEADFASAALKLAGVARGTRFLDVAA